MAAVVAAVTVSAAMVPERTSTTGAFVTAAIGAEASPSWVVVIIVIFFNRVKEWWWWQSPRQNTLFRIPRCGGRKEETGRRDGGFIEREAGALHQLAKGIMSIPH